MQRIELFFALSVEFLFKISDLCPTKKRKKKLQFLFSFSLLFFIYICLPQIWQKDPSQDLSSIEYNACHLIEVQVG